MSRIPSKEIWQHINDLDRAAIEAIISKSPHCFSEYILQSRNTICGKNVIKLLLCLVKQYEDNGTGKFKAELIDYTQSGRVMDKSDSSVSYASISFTL